MKEVKIYTIVSDQLSPPITGESFCTDMVRHSDYADLEEKRAALAAENAGLKKSEVEFNEYCRHECEDVGDTWVDDFTDTPATDAFLDEVRAQAFNDLCSAFVKDATVVGLDDGDIVTVKEATDALLHCADQLRKGVHS
ncbi:ead/Ea22-like family protein [Salmonella enterica subsp. enterica serovar Chailey]|uniref:Ead/Ea22-like family protein n=2 Tax=Salmonella enterica TaxID=28901 RepID=A0A5Z4BFS6_SALER|nr:ead/Ea22-like family protein [Salmonella enterica]EAP5797656.1 ead/Ea22-like family protein [Salmonella enterica subsp. enterica serovar Goldcoast]EAP9828131.1 ead/Ea22-like family protein [Salmonella enterica subsp. enterica serovar Chailey]EBH0907316.1 ead/Ea22-like family protein [Salmonella enterica subsp. enterica serovar Blockley]ECU4020309.1 ead/Ea22-like family protein [Salmonella enterica subsp. enterica serovar Manhattan]EDJ2050576.1 ead/Ea22-like family protein [Salmonella enteri